MKENDKVELKRELTNGIEKEAIAFLNSEGGTIFVGVEDNGNVIGIDKKLQDRIDTKLSSIITDSIFKEMLINLLVIIFKLIK